MRNSCLTSRFAIASGIISLLAASTLTAQPESQDPLISQLQNSNAAVRRNAAEALAQVAIEDLKTALPILQNSLKDGDPDVRYYCLVTMAVSAYGSEANG